MASWYISSAANAALTQFATTHAYVIGDIVRRLTGTTYGTLGAWRCTTAGTSAGSEPTWPTSNNGTVTSGSAVFTNVSGQSTYGWGAAAGDIGTLDGTVWATRLAGGDTAFLSSDHTENKNSGALLNQVSASYSVLQLLSVNRGGSTPPVAADLTAGATVSTTGAVTLTVDWQAGIYFNGVTLSPSLGLLLGSSGVKSHYYKNCSISITGSSGVIKPNNPGKVTLDNCILTFGNIANTINGGASYMFDFTMLGGSMAGTVPTFLTSDTTGSGGNLVTFRGVDLSSVTTTLVKNFNVGGKYLFDCCKIAAAVARYNTASIANQGDVIELVNCYDSTNIISERYTPAGTLTTERTIVLSSGDGGATDDVGLYSHKLVSTANVDKFTAPFESFSYPIEASTGSKTIGIEMISSAALNNDDIAIYVEYQGTTSSSVASFIDSFIATPLTAAAAITTSTVTWNSSPATPAKQKMAVTFTVNQAGIYYVTVKLGKASTTCYINPRPT